METNVVEKENSVMRGIVILNMEITVGLTEKVTFEHSKNQRL